MQAIRRQERTNKRLAVALACLVAAITAVAIARTGDRTFRPDRDLFRVSELRTVDRVLLESADGKVDLAYTSGRWRVNDAFPADRGLIDVLFATLQQVQPKRPVAQSTRDSIAAALEQRGTKVTLFRESDEALSFHAGGNAAKTQAFFKRAGQPEPYLVAIPGYSVYVAGIFELPAHQWRERLIFDFNWGNFRSLDASFKNPRGNFTVGINGRETFLQNAPADTARLNTFLNDLSLLRAAEYLPGPPALRDSVPVVIWTIADVASRAYTLEVFESDRRFYGRVNSGHWAMLDRQSILPLLRPKEYFVKP